MSAPGIAFCGVTKSYGDTQALDDVSFTASPGKITGFVGRNGAGKTTALRVLLGLAHPDRGTASFDGKSLVDLPAATVGVALEPSFHPGRTARAHLVTVATALGVPVAEVDRALSEVDLAGAAKRRIRGFSLGMRQRLSLATALLGDPTVLVLDEPATGLDPDGIVWLRGRLREAADAGATVLASSHLLGELEQMADDVVVLEQRVLWQGPISDVSATAAPGSLEDLFHEVTGLAGAATGARV